MRSSRVLRLGVGFKPRTPPPSRPPRSPSSLNRLSEAKRAKPGKPGVFPPSAAVYAAQVLQHYSKLTKQQVASRVLLPIREITGRLVSLTN